jgi:hypothetical protein
MNELDYYKGYKKYKMKYRQEMAALSGGGLSEDERQQFIAELRDIDERRAGHEIPQFKLIREYITKLENNEVSGGNSLEHTGDKVNVAMVKQLITKEKKYIARLDKHSAPSE